jgi:ABC-2 type transport system ATP-binding protein
MQDVKELCERVIVIDHGAILYDGKLEHIIKKFATHKILSIVISKRVEKHELERLGIIKDFNFPRIKLEVPIEKSNHTAAHILNTFPVQDLNIEEPDIEEIIRAVFTNANGSL